jgi:hypothetical protein
MIIPDKNLFIVTSALKPLSGHFGDAERYQQTLDGLRSIRKIVPDAIIVTSDVSVRPLTEMEKNSVAEKSNIFVDMSQDKIVMDLSNKGLKSLAENVLLFNTIQTLRNSPEVSHVFGSVKRIFKFSARTILEDSFDIKEYDNLFGKFVFKKRIPTWMNPPTISDLFITRMYSFCPSLIDTYLNVIGQNIPLVQQGFDTEHAHFHNIPKEHLVEFDRLHCYGWLAGNGKIEYY